MPLTYKINVLEELKKRGYSTNRLRQESILSESVIQHLRTGKPVSMTTLDKLCGLLSIDISDLIEYKPDLSKEEEELTHTAIDKFIEIMNKGRELGFCVDHTLDVMRDTLIRIKSQIIK